MANPSSISEHPMSPDPVPRSCCGIFDCFHGRGDVFPSSHVPPPKQDCIFSVENKIDPNLGIMGSADKNEEDVVLHRLSQTHYACSSLSKLATRPANFVYRGVLIKSFVTQDGATATTVIIKHSTDSVHTVMITLLPWRLGLI